MKVPTADSSFSHHSATASHERVVSSLPAYRQPIHPLHALCLAFLFPLYLTAWLSDLAYIRSYHVQWLNFSQWVVVGALLFGAFALLWSLIDLIRARPESRRQHATYFVLLLLTFVLGFINELVHSKDAFATMPTGLYLSFVLSVLALAASWVGYSGFPSGFRSATRPDEVK